MDIGAAKAVQTQKPEVAPAMALTADQEQNSLPVWARPEDEILATLNADRAQGLSEAEAKARQKKHGLNSLPEEEQESVWQSLIEAFKDPLAVILTLAAVLSAAIGLAQNETEELQQAGWIMGIVVFMTLVGYFTERSASNELAKLKDLQKVFARIIRGGNIIQVESKEIVPGDIVFLTQGSRVPADSRVLEAVNASVNEALLTGEPFDVSKSPEPLPPDTVLSRRANMVYAGTFVTTGNITAIATSTGIHTELGKIWQELVSAEDTQTPLQKQLEQLGKMLRPGGGGGAGNRLHPGGARCDHHNCTGARRARDGYEKSDYPATPRGGRPGIGQRSLHRQNRNRHLWPHVGHAHLDIRYERGAH
jgi:Ca2+-transporting ATPase